MTKSKEWNEFLDNMLNCATEEYKATKEYAYLYRRREVIDEMLTTNLSEQQKKLVDDILFELTLAAERETTVLYQKGLQDGIRLLKNLGVLA